MKLQNVYTPILPTKNQSIQNILYQSAIDETS